MQEKVKTIQVRQKQNQIWQKIKGNRKKTPTNKMKTNNMKLMLCVHYCKLNPMSMNNNKVIL